MRIPLLLAIAASFCCSSEIGAVPPPNAVNRGGGPIIPQRPAVSPYLALTTPGRFGRVGNYYTFVRPYQQQQALNQQQGAALMRLEQQLQSPPPPVFGGNAGSPPLTTGNRAWFMNHTPYFGGGTVRGAPQ
ncbi:MAG: hypothetical protein KY475_03945 [Planctomycetes bacterium]|nr:hypothetical protein [Planctomycetota bacterium]